MPKIKKLSDNEAKKIAAGEVVDRPSNVVKELIENSVDAGATDISIYLNEAGKNLIKIIDNGCGMSFDDAILCFEHHATSKINSIEDLNSLKTFGFRGEALSSISAISKIKLITKEPQSEIGSHLELNDGKILFHKKISCSTGTQLEISDLFYNVPARLKFLKKTETELRQTFLLFQAFCLSNLNIHFKLFHEGIEIYNCPPVSDLSSRISQLWDYNFAQNIIFFSESEQSINLEISGGISSHNFSRFNKNQIFLFVNGRWVKNYNLIKSILKGYMNVLQEGRFPAAFIFINLPSNQLDVNVHPKKEEVHFISTKKIEQFLQNLVKKNLENYLSKQLNKKIEFHDEKIKNNFIPATQTTLDIEQIPFFEPTDSFNAENHLITQNNLNIEWGSFPEKIEEKKLNVDFVDIENNLKVIGQFKLTYILIEKDDGLFLMDQHAAHERILYELFSKRFHEVATVPLIFPIIITLKESEIQFIEDYFEIFHLNGIDIERFSKDQLVIKTIPVHIKDIKMEELINQIIIWVEENQNLEKNDFFKIINEKIRAQMACKAAVKAGDPLSKEQIVQLIQNLERAENNFTCPHGRPTGWLLSAFEIEKKFKRKF